MYQRIQNRTNYSLYDKHGAYEKGMLEDNKIKKKTVNTGVENYIPVPLKKFKADQPCTSTSSQSIDSFHNIESTDENTVQDTFIELPLSHNISSLSGIFDIAQAYVIREENSYILVIIKKVIFKDKPQFISGCSDCYNLNSDFLLFLEASGNYYSSDYNFNKCSHIRLALSDIMNNFNSWKSVISLVEIQNILIKNCTWEKETDLFANEKSKDFCGSLTSSDGIILYMIKNGKWRCGGCGFKIAEKCRHGQKYVFPQGKDGDECIVTKDEDYFTDKSQMISNELISVNSLRQIFFQRTLNLESYLKHEFLIHNPEIYTIIPEAKTCHVCQNELFLQKRKAFGFLVLNVIVKCDVYDARCENMACPNYANTISFSGSSYGIINYGNKFFVGVELIVEYMNLYAKNGLSFTAWFKNKLSINSYSTDSIYADTNHITSYIGMLHAAFCIATTLFDYDKSVFFCCEEPSIVSLDAIVNSVKKNRMFEFAKPWISSTQVSRSSKRSERQLSSLNEEFKVIILNVLEQKTITFDILTHLRECDHTGVKALSYCFKKETEHEYVLAEIATMFASTLIKTVAAINTIIPSICVTIIQKIIKDWLIGKQDILILKAHTPTIYGLYVTILNNNDKNDKARDACINLLMEMIEKRNNIFSKGGQEYSKDISEQEYEDVLKKIKPFVTAPSLDILELYKTGCFFPGYRVKRTIIDIKIPGEKFECNKIYKDARTMGPGTLYLFCVVHQKCLGFIVLDKPESTRIVTQTLLTRFSKLPQNIIYDNGCNLNEFILNRYPKELENSRIYVDGFHYHSHNNCAKSYDFSSHPDITKGVNSSLLEQKNSRYAKMKATSPFLKLSNFMAKLRFTAMYYNTQ